MKYYVYLHIKADTGEPFYVGKGSGKRAYSKYKRSNFWNRVVDKHGFDVILLEENLSEKESFEQEKYWIQRIGRRNLGTGTLVNLTQGGEGIGTDKNISDVFRKKCSERMIGNTINNGRKHSEEVNKKKGSKGEKNGMFGKISPLRGKSHPNNSKAYDGLICINLETGIFYDSINELSRATGINKCTLNYQLKNNNNKTLKLI